MASGTKLHLVFGTNSASKATFNYNYADREVTTATVRALMNGMITNGSIFENVPTAIESAKLVTTAETTLQVEA